MPGKYSTASDASTNGAESTPASDPKLETQAMSFADLAQFTADGTWLDLKQAAEYAGRQKSTLRAAIAKLGTIFNADSLRKVEIAGTGFPPLMYVSKAALDQWVAQRDQAGDTGTRQRSNAKGRKYFVWITDGDYTINDSFTFSKADLTVAFKPKAEKQSASADQTAPVTDDAKASASELELVEA